MLLPLMEQVSPGAQCGGALDLHFDRLTVSLIRRVRIAEDLQRSTRTLYRLDTLEMRLAKSLECHFLRAE